MSRQRRTFTPQFKHEAASLVLDQGYSCPEAAKFLDVGETALRRWVERGGITPTAKALTSEQQTIQELQAHINRLELEKKILKETTALLMAEAHGRRR